MGLSFQNVAAAWSGMREWVNKELPPQALYHDLPDHAEKAGKHCSLCNRMGTGWTCNGHASITMYDLKITALSGVSHKSAYQGSSVTSQLLGGIAWLPFSFRELKIDGKYKFEQPCLYGYVGGTLEGIYDAYGTVTQVIDADESNELAYRVPLNHDELTLDDVRVSRDPRIDLVADDGGLPGWLNDVVNFLNGGGAVAVVRESIQNVFTTASFTRTMIELLRKKLDEPPRAQEGVA